MAVGDTDILGAAQEENMPESILLSRWMLFPLIVGSVTLAGALVWLVCRRPEMWSRFPRPLWARIPLQIGVVAIAGAGYLMVSLMFVGMALMQISLLELTRQGTPGTGWVLLVNGTLLALGVLLGWVLIRRRAGCMVWAGTVVAYLLASWFVVIWAQ